MLTQKWRESTTSNIQDAGILIQLNLLSPCVYNAHNRDNQV